MIYEFGTEQINQKLCEKEESGYQSNVTERNMVVTMKFQKKKRCEVCRNSLCDKSHITGYFCLMVVSFFTAFIFYFPLRMFLTVLCSIFTFINTSTKKSVLGGAVISILSPSMLISLSFIHLKIIRIPLFFFLLDYIANIKYIH